MTDSHASAATKIGTFASPATSCPRCQLALPLGVPFCPRDGSLVNGPFDLGDRYLIDETLGTGGMALVFGARHKVLGKRVAVKILRDGLAAQPEHAQRFLREARIASQLHDDNIVGVSDFGHDQARGLLYCVMDRLAGNTLASELRARVALPWRRVIEVLLPLSRALATAHASGVLHRDLNPKNVFLVQSSGRHDVVKLCDFGLSRLAGGEDRVTATGVFLGTPAYMAPEQIRGDVDQTAKVDLYALGVTAYEMLTGVLPHQATTPVAMVASKLTDDPPPLAPRLSADAPQALPALIMRCLARDPALRPASALDIERELTDLLGRTEKPAATLAGEVLGQFCGSYRLVSLLGAGGVGSVYLAEHPLIGTKVAVKILLPEVAGIPGMVERFVQEARAASQIGSPHLPRYLDFGHLPGGQPFAVMEYLEGETIAARISREGALPVHVVARLIDQVATALASAHAAGIIHRDIKPENLFLVRGEQGEPLVKVLDFGIAKLAMPSGEGRLTAQGFILGTPYYAAPEQLLAQDVDLTADVYALGATMFEMLTGRRPFEGDIGRLLQAKAMTVAPSIRQSHPELPTPLARLVASMLERATTDRPQSMAALRSALRPFLGGTTEQVPAPVLNVPQRSRTKVAIIVAGGLVVALGIVLALAWPKPVKTATPPVASEPATVVASEPPAPTVAPRPAVEPVARPEPVAAAAEPPPARTPAAKPKAPTVKAKAPAARPKADIVVGDPWGTKVAEPWDDPATKAKP